MLKNIFIFIVVITCFILFIHLCGKYREGVSCINNNAAIDEITKKVQILNKTISLQNNQMDVIRNTLSDILNRTNKFKFFIGKVQISKTDGPSLDISGQISNPVLNISINNPPAGIKGDRGRVGMYGPRGIPGNLGDRGPVGYWGGLQ